MTRIEMVRPSYTPWEKLKEAAFTCDLCGKTAYGPTDQMHEAIAEHRRIGCTGRAGAKRFFEIWYPR